jgi:hypothetical protein
MNRTPPPAPSDGDLVNIEMTRGDASHAAVVIRGSAGVYDGLGDKFAARAERKIAKTIEAALAVEPSPPTDSLDAAIRA